MPKILILQISVGGTALTLHRAHRVIFAELSWVPADVAQAAARCHRIGQKKSVLATLVSLSGSIDERVVGTLMRKSRELAALEALVGMQMKIILEINNFSDASKAILMLTALIQAAGRGADTPARDRCFAEAPQARREGARSPPRKRLP